MPNFLMEKFAELTKEAKDEDIIEFKEEFDKLYSIEDEDKNEEEENEEDNDEEEVESEENEDQEEDEEPEKKKKKKKMYNGNESKEIKAEIIEYKLLNFANKNDIDVDLVDFLSIDSNSDLEVLKEKLLNLDRKVNKKTTTNKTKKTIFNGKTNKKIIKKKEEDDFIDYGKLIGSKYR